MATKKHNFSRKYIPVYLTLCVGIAITAIAGKIQIEREKESQHIRLKQQSDRVAFILQRSFDRYIEVLLSIQDYYQTSQQVSFREFKTFTARALSAYSGITALQWVPEVTRQERVTFEEKIRKEQLSSFQIVEYQDKQLVRAGERSSFFPVTYISPFSPSSSKILGFDLGSEPNRRDAVNRATASGKIVTTGRISLIEDNNTQYAFLALAPIKNANNRSDTVVGVFRIADIAKEHLKDFQDQYKLYFYNSINRNDDSYLGMLNSETKQFTIESNLQSDLASQVGSLCQSSSDCVRILKVGDREWSVLIIPSERFGREQESYIIPLILVGLLITFGASTYFGTIIYSAEKLEIANREIARLNADLKSDNVRMEAELSILQKMQMMILPQPHELLINTLDIAGFSQPAEKVGGDYFDILNSHGVVTASIGDVSGHGLESGILMLMTQTAVRTLKEVNITDPVEFLDILNRTLYDNLQRMNSSKNLTLILLNYSDGILNISGQHEEVLFVKENGELERVDTIDLGFPIGLDKDIKNFIDYKVLKLNYGEGVVLYTDGITEAQNLQNEFYGMERLCKMVSDRWQLPAKQIQQEIIEDLYNFIGEQKIYDDITLLIIKQEKLD